MNTRKQIRLEHYDYSQNGAYFITICTNGRLPILSQILDPSAGASIAPKPELSEIGKIVENAVQAIPAHYPETTVDNYVIMPNHIHMLLRIDRKTGRAMLAPTTVSEMIRQMKGYVTKKCGKTIWQKSFYDHIIRTEQDYLDAWQYIDGNSSKWCEDDLYVSETYSGF